MPETFPNKVWVVHQGCMYEGGSAKALCATKETAIRFARHLAKGSYSHVRWRRREDGTRQRYSNHYTRNRDNPLKWECHSDIILIYLERIF